MKWTMTWGAVGVASDHERRLGSVAGVRRIVIAELSQTVETIEECRVFVEEAGQNREDAGEFLY